MRGVLFAATAVLFSASAQAQLTMPWRGAVSDEHVFTRALVRFQELKRQYSGKKTNWCCTRTASSAWRSSNFE